ncbi:hypothetical protein A8144_04115 [Mycobacterium leprae 3125609]|nr:hypothetical protein A8144_04115 [Mycobacterium leprae 3125609]
MVDLGEKVISHDDIASARSSSRVNEAKSACWLAAGQPAPRRHGIRCRAIKHQASGIPLTTSGHEGDLAPDCRPIDLADIGDLVEIGTHTVAKLNWETAAMTVTAAISICQGLLERIVAAITPTVDR